MFFITSELGCFSTRREIRRAFGALGKAILNDGSLISRAGETRQLSEREVLSVARLCGGQNQTLWRHAGEMEAREGLYFTSDETYPICHRFAMAYLGLEVECKESVEDI